MTMERNSGQIVFRCDGAHCHEFIETETTDFLDALNTAKSNGWRPVKDVSGEWEHLCPECGDS